MSSEEIAQFVAITGADIATASRYLAQHGGLQEATAEYYSREVRDATPASSALRLLLAQRIALFADLEARNNLDTNLFAGGGKSGLEVENPDSRRDARGLVQDLLRKAAEPHDYPAQEGLSDDEQTPQPHFTGTGYRLGDGLGPAETIAAPAQPAHHDTRVTRNITFWRDGFQVGEGRLYRYDDPANEAYLNALNLGRAPLDLLDVQFGQDVDVKVDKRLDEDYVPPKRKLEGFHGQGQRLGSVVPGETEHEPAVQPAAPATPTAPAAAATAAAQDAGSGDARVAVRLANGQRLVHNFHSTDSVAEVVAFVARHLPDPSRAFQLVRGFPPAPLDPQETVASAKLAGDLVVQRWA